MNRKVIPAVIYLLLAASTTFAQSYPKDNLAYRQVGFGNPIDTPFVLAGTFGEIRPDHFHTGIDFSTGKEQGKSVYAVADGYVSRIKISAGGFGKAIYVTHPNGFVTVYAHLKNFSEPIEKYIRKIQYKKESFEVDESVDANKLKIKKGSVIAWSGNTGASSGPHLHFEIRDERTEEPINPLLFGYEITDHLKPEIKSVRLYPVPGQGVVVDSDRPRSYDVVNAPEGLIIPVTDYIQVFGKIGFEFSIVDHQENNDAPLGIYSMQLNVDTQQIFSMKYDRLNFSDSRFVNAHIDYEAKYDGDGVYERCFRLSGDKLKLYGDTSQYGYFEFLEDGVHDVSFVVTDFSGNATELKFQLLSYSSLSNADYQSQPEDYFAMIPDKGLAIHKSDVEIVIPANSIYDVLLFTNTQTAQRKGYYSPTFEIGDPHVPLHLPITVSLKPQHLPDELKSKAIVVSFDKKNKPVYEGSDWGTEFLSAKTRHFGTFSIAVDTIGPAISLATMPGDNNPGGHALRIKITDEFSGIKTYSAKLDGNWFLMEYDAKNNLLISDMKEVTAGKPHHIEITVTDAVGNTTVLPVEIQ
ncbi:MAG: M23 family metallopeptidase [Bacteroidota bacterium]